MLRQSDFGRQNIAKLTRTIDIEWTKHFKTQKFHNRDDSDNFCLLDVGWVENGEEGESLQEQQTSFKIVY